MTAVPYDYTRWLRAGAVTWSSYGRLPNDPRRLILDAITAVLDE